MRLQIAFELLPLCVAAAILPAADAAAQVNWFVDDDAAADPSPNDPDVSDPLEDGSVDHPFDAIQEAINVAVNGDTCVIADGTYIGEGNRDLDFGGRLITLRSENGPDTCIVDCQGSAEDPHRGLHFHTGETADAIVEGLTITGGSIPGPGGALYIFDGCSPTIVNCRFFSNSAGMGAGMYVGRDSNPTVIGCDFIENHASDDGGGMYNVDGSSPTLIDCLFNGNCAVDDGGGIYNWFLSSPVVLNSVFVGNYGGEGGAIYNLQNGSPILMNCVLSGNSAIFGAAMQTHDGAPVLTNCTIVGNLATSEVGGLRSFGSRTNHPSLANCILWGNSGAQISDFDGTNTIVSYSDVQGGWPGQGNIDKDPLLYCAGGPDDIFGTVDDEVFLLTGSPCIDAGNNTAVPPDVFDLDGDGDVSEQLPIDLDGLQRFVDDPNALDSGAGLPPIVDMGAFEYRLGDLDGDRDVDIEDGTTMFDCTKGPSIPSAVECRPADLDGDTDVDLSDSRIFLIQFTGPVSTTSRG